MSKYNVAPLKAVGLEGLFGLISVVSLLPAFYYGYGINHPGGAFDIPNGWHEGFKNIY